MSKAVIGTTVYTKRYDVVSALKQFPVSLRGQEIQHEIS